MPPRALLLISAALCAARYAKAQDPDTFGHAYSTSDQEASLASLDLNRLDHLDELDSFEIERFHADGTDGATVAAWAASEVANVGVTSGSSSCDYGIGTSNCPSSPSYAQCGGAGLVCGARVRTGAYPYLDGYVVWNGDNPSDPNVLVCYDGWTSGHNGNGYGVNNNDGSCTAIKTARCYGTRAAWWTTCSTLTVIVTPTSASPTDSPTATPTSSSPTTSTSSCDAGASCGMCLVAIPAAECPASGHASWPNCNSVAVGELCEGDGECGTDTGLNNCRTEGIYDFYRRVLPGYTGSPTTDSPTATPTSSAPTTAAVCGAGWQHYGGMCYRSFTTRRTWSAALSDCRARGGDLASIHNAQENTFVSVDVLGGSMLAWVGGTDASSEGTWTWSDGSPWLFSNWHPAQPDNYRGNQDCMVTNFHGQGLWDDELCTLSFPYACQAAVPTAAPTTSAPTTSTEECEPEPPVPWDEHKAVLVAIEVKRLQLLETKLLVRQCESGLQRLPGYIPPTASPTSPAAASPTAASPTYPHSAD